MFEGSSLRRRQNVETISSSVFDQLTDELLIEILIRLPLKPANICKCISLRFRALISSSYFVRCYVNHHQINDSFALFLYSGPIYNSTCPRPIIDLVLGPPIFESAGFSLSFLSCPEQEKEGNIRYLASNNGLVLCCADICPPVVYFVCNPLTKQWISLPPPPSYVKNPYVGLICNPQYSCNDHELGNTTFKVVQIEVAYGKSQSSTLTLEIFCSVSGRWTKEYSTSSATPGYEFYYHRWYRSAVVCGGMLHWVALLNQCIFSYDPYNGKCRTVEFPCGTRQRWPSKFCLGESAGRLRYCNVSMDGTSFQVWELEDYNINGGEWLLLHKVHLDEMKSTVDHTLNKGRLGLLPPHPLNQDIVFFWCPSLCRIVEYNMRNKLMKFPCFIRDAKNKIMFHSYHKVFPFVLPSWPTTIPPIQHHRLS